MLAEHDKIVPYIVLIKQWSFKMFKIELNAHYLNFWTQIYNFLVIWVIYTNYASDVTLILGLSSIFIYLFFFDRRTLKFLIM